MGAGHLRHARRRRLRLLRHPRGGARRFFKIDGPSVAVRTLQLLAKEGKVDADVPAKAAAKYRLDDVTAGTSGNAGGES